MLADVGGEFLPEASARRISIARIKGALLKIGTAREEY